MIEHYNEFRDYLQKACGILLGDNKQYLVSSRVGRIMADNSIENLSELVKQMQRGLNSSPLRQSVIDAMTTNETLWFRDSHPYNILKQKLLPEIAKNKGTHKIRIWSAACSSGQEPYSISMSLEEYKRSAMGVLKPVEIIATDLSRAILDAAQRGRYDSLSIGRGLSQDRLRTYFDKDDNNWCVKSPIKACIRFRSLNLLESYSLLGKFDIVFCRNVLIYFSPQLKSDILRRIHATLNPGGYLLLGASEGLNNLQDLYEMVQCSPGIIYRAK